MGQEFRITITAADKASEVIDQINAKMDRLVLPIERTQKAANLLDKEKGLKNAGNSIWKMGQVAMTTEKRFGGMVSTILGAAARLGPIGAVGGVMIAIGATGLSAANKWSQFGFEIDRTSKRLGISTKDLQRYRQAADLLGVSQDKTTSAIHDFGMTAQKAMWGRDQTARYGFNLLGVPIRSDIPGMLEDTIEKLGSRNVPVQAKEEAAGLLGLSELLPVIIEGTDRWKNKLQQVDEANAITSERGIKAAEKLVEANKLLNLELKAITVRLQEEVYPEFGKLYEYAISVVRRLREGIGGNGDGSPSYSDPESGVPADDSKEGNKSVGFPAFNRGGGWSVNRGKEQEEIMRQLMGYGWSKEQAAGITANLIRESSLNPQAVSPSGKYRGLAQWNPERQKTFKKVMGMDVMDASRQKQVDFINWELNNTHRAAGWYLKGSRSKEDAAAAFTRHYEIPGDMAGEIARRRQIASNIPLASADGILQPSSPAGGSPGKITVDVNFQNAPPGTQVRNYVEGPVSANTRIGYSNPGTL